MSVVSMLVGRIHVGTPDCEVLRDMHHRMVTARKRGEPLTRPQRRQIYREALDCHHANQDLYRDVVSGRI